MRPSTTSVSCTGTSFAPGVRGAPVEALRVPRLVATIVGYALLLLALIAAVQYLARADGREYVRFNTGGPLSVVIYADVPLPFGLGGGPHPGNVELVDDRNNVLDQDRIGDVRAIQGVVFSKTGATFRYLNHGAVRVVTLNADE